MNKREFIELLKKENTEFPNERMARNLANSLESLSSDIFTEYIRFIFELIQNADDAEAIDIEIFQMNNYLIVSHNGKAFDEKDIEAICSIGDGTKINDENKTGYKGIGFKSVFGKSNNITIISNGYQFQFNNSYKHPKYPNTKMPWQIIPQWIEIKTLPSYIANYLQLNKYNVSTIIDINSLKDINNELNELLSNGKILLFLRSTKRIILNKDDSQNYIVEKNIIKSTSNIDEVELIKNEQNLSNWIVTTFDQIPIDEKTQYELNKDDKTPDKLKRAKYTEISFAAKVNNGKIKIVQGEESLIYTYLPTKVMDFEFPFLINGSFLTNASREGIHEDRVWNQWLFQLIGEKIFDWFELLSQSKFKYQILHLLPNKFNSIYNELKISFDKSFDLYGKSKCFIPNKSSQLKKAPEILIDKTGLSEQDFIPIDVIIEYINREAGKTYSESSFVHPQLELKDNLKNLGAYTFDLENLEDFFTDQLFINNHQPSQNFALIKYFYIKSTNAGNDIWMYKVQNIKFIFSEQLLLKRPGSILFPSYDYENETNSEIFYINSEVYSELIKEPEIIEWLESIGVKDPSDESFLTNTILSNLDTCITPENYLSIFLFIFKMHKRKKIHNWKYSDLKKLKLMTTQNKFVIAGDCYLSNIYSPSIPMENEIAAGDFISYEYTKIGDPIELRSLFLKIGVSEKIKPISFEKIKHSDIMDKNNTHLFSIDLWHYLQEIKSEYSFPIDSYDITTITFVKYIENYKVSILFWSHIFKEEGMRNSYLQHSRGYWGYADMRGQEYGTRADDPYLIWKVKNKKCIPTNQKKCMSHKEVYTNTDEELVFIIGKYFPVLNTDTKPSDKWVETLELRTELYIFDYLMLLVKISEDNDENHKNSTLTKKRIGLIYKKLSEIIPQITEYEKRNLPIWLYDLKLLSTTGSFENANELKWVRIEGYTNTSEDHLKLLFIPENCETNNNNFEELLQLIGVQIIDSFIPDIKNKVPNATLKIQLQVILPFFTAILERKHYLDFSDEFKRLSKIIDNTEFYNASEIVLSFKNQDEIILGPSLHAYLSDSELSFKGKWTSPITLYALIPELLKLFKLSGLSDELKLLIQLDENEIKQWLVEQGYELTYIEEKPEYTTAIEKVKSYTTEEDTEQSVDLVDNSDERSRITISLEAKEIIFDKLRDKNFVVPNALEINYTIVRGIKNPKGFPIKVVVKSGKAGKLYFNPSEWLALTESDTQLFVVTRGNIVRNVTLKDLTAINDTFHMRFNTQAFAVNTNLKAFANFFRYLPYTHFIFDTPESTTDYLQQFGLNERNPSSKELTSDDKNLLH